MRLRTPDAGWRGCISRRITSLIDGGGSFHRHSGADAAASRRDPESVVFVDPQWVVGGRVRGAKAPQASHAVAPRNRFRVLSADSADSPGMTSFFGSRDPMLLAPVIPGPTRLHRVGTRNRCVAFIQENRRAPCRCKGITGSHPIDVRNRFRVLSADSADSPGMTSFFGSRDPMLLAPVIPGPTRLHRVGTRNRCVAFIQENRRAPCRCKGITGSHPIDVRNRFRVLSADSADSPGMTSFFGSRDPMLLAPVIPGPTRLHRVGTRNRCVPVDPRRIVGASRRGAQASLDNHAKALRKRFRVLSADSADSPGMASGMRRP